MGTAGRRWAAAGQQTLPQPRHRGRQSPARLDSFPSTGGGAGERTDIEYHLFMILPLILAELHLQRARSYLSRFVINVRRDINNISHVVTGLVPPPSRVTN